MAALIELYKKEHVEITTLEGFAQNKPAIQLYQQHGYEISGYLLIYQTDNIKRIPKEVPGFKIRSNTDEQAQVQTLSLLQLEVDPAHPDAEELTRQLLAHVMISSPKASRYRFFYCPWQKKVVIDWLEQIGFQVFVNNVHMVKKITTERYLKRS